MQRCNISPNLEFITELLWWSWKFKLSKREDSIAVVGGSWERWIDPRSIWVKAIVRNGTQTWNWIIAIAISNQNKRVQFINVDSKSKNPLVNIWKIKHQKYQWFANEGVLV